MMTIQRIIITDFVNNISGPSKSIEEIYKRTEIVLPSIECDEATNQWMMGSSSCFWCQVLIERSD